MTTHAKDYDPRHDYDEHLLTQIMTLDIPCAAKCAVRQWYMAPRASAVRQSQDDTTKSLTNASRLQLCHHRVVHVTKDTQVSDMPTPACTVLKRAAQATYDEDDGDGTVAVRRGRL